MKILLVYDNYQGADMLLAYSKKLRFRYTIIQDCVVRDQNHA